MKKQSIRLDRGTYSLCSNEDDELFILANFLTGDVAGDLEARCYRRWINNPTEMGSGGNSSDLEKIGNNIVIKNIYDEDFGTGNERSITLSKDNFLEILDSWKEFHTTKPEKIVLVMDDKGYVSLVPASK